MNQAAVHQYQREDDWDAIAELFAGAAKRLVDAGAQAVMFCANTPHKIYGQVEQSVNVPILHIADATASTIKAKKIDAVGFLGTKFSMSQPFVVSRIARHDIEVYVPEEKDEQEELHRIIQKELTFGKVEPESKEYVLDLSLIHI